MVEIIITTHGGHNRIVPGARGYLDEVTEDRRVNKYFKDGMRDLGHKVYDCTDNEGTTQNQNLANIVRKCNSHKAKYGFSFHLNSFNKKARGVEVCVYDSRSKRLAEKICKEISNALDIPNRGVKYRPELYVIRATNDLMFLVECCFCDNREDAENWSAKKCANAVIKAVTGKTPKPAKKPKPTAERPPKFNTCTVKVTSKALNIRKTPNTDYPPVGKLLKGGVYTIVQKQGDWGRLKSGAGWINLKFTRKVV